MRKILHSDMDECWLDISGYNSRDPETVAYEIKETMKEELGLTVSVGVSYNKIFAKLGSDMKKPDAVTVIPKDTFREKIWGLPASDLLFVGRATERFLNRFYIRTIGDLANTDPDFLKSHIGVNGIKLWRYANGLDNSPVMYSDYRPIVKSVGHGTTTVEDLKSNKEVWITILELTQDIGHRLKILGLNCMGISICIRNEDLMFKEWQRKLNFATQSPFVIAKLAYDLFLQKYVWNKNIRSVSTKGQVDKNDIPMQKQSCREFAQRQGWCIVKEFQEKGISGYKVSAENRDAMIELRKAAERKEFDILLVFMFDRIGRMDDETPYVVKWFIKHGIRVWSVVEGEQRMDNHVDKLMNYIRFWQANGESEKTSARVKTRLSQMVQEGMYTGGNVPYGYKLVKSGQKNKKGKELMMVVIDEDEAPIIKSIFSMTLREGYGSYQIAKQLNEKGLRTHRGSKFQANTIRRILRNKMFCGYLIAGENESPHLPDLEIISENVFKQVQFIMDQRSAKDDEKKQIALRTKGKTQLAGNLYCGHCGRKLIATTHTYYYDRADGTRVKTVKQRYICTNSGRDRGICNGQGAYLAEKVDEVVLEVVRKYLDAIKVTPKSLTMEKQYKAEIADTKKRKKKIEAELEKLKKQSVKLSAEIGKVLIGESNYTSDMLTTSINVTNQAIAEKENEIAEIELKLANQQDDIGKLDFYYDEFMSWADEFDLSTNEERKMIICKLIKQIRLYKGYQFEIDFDSDYKRFLKEFTMAS